MDPVNITLMNSTIANFSLNEAISTLEPLLILIQGVVLYSFFIFKFYRYLAKRDVLELNLKEYNKFEHPFLRKLIAIPLYFLEFLFIFPVIIFFWFLILSILIGVLSNTNFQHIFLISMAIVVSVRIISYYSEDLSKDLAKMIPFALLGVLIVDMSSFSLTQPLVIIKQIPSMGNMIIYYLLLTIALEIVLRIITGIISLLISVKEDKRSYP